MNRVLMNGSEPMEGDQPRRVECLCDLELAELAQGTGASEVPDHVLACDSCGARLKLLMEIQEAAPSVEEERERLALASSSRGWKVRIAKRLARDARRSAGRSERWVRWSDLLPWQHWASAALVAPMLVVAFLGWSYYQNPVRVSARLLAQTYTVGRQFEWRLPDAGWTQLQTKRGATRTRPAPLLEAEAVLTRDQSTHENDPQWLELRARAEILDLRLESAIDLLKRALQISPKSTEVLTDLAVAYGLNADIMDRPEEFQAVVDYTTQALASDPEHRRALFNRATAFERLHMVDRAVADWEQYLQKEKDPAWSREARERLEQLQTTQRKRARLLELDDRSDAVLELKVLRWLSADRARARAVGRSLFGDYGDVWLSEAAEEPVDSRPLLEAAKSVADGRYDDASKRSEEAARLYERQSAPAHLARAQLEAVNALNRKEQAEACETKTAKLIGEAQARGYRWIQVRALLQQGSCSHMLEKLGVAEEQTLRAKALASTYGIKGLEARAVGLEVSYQTAEGDLWAAWRENRNMLAQMVDSPYSLYRIHQALSNYSSSAELGGWLAASFEFMRAAADIIQNTNQVNEAANRARAAGLALAVHLDREYAEESRKAEELFRTLPDSGTPKLYHNSIQVLEGESYLRAGRVAAAIPVLKSVEFAVALPREQWRVHELLGQACFRTGASEAALEEFHRAAGILDHRIATLSPGYRRSEARRDRVEANREYAAVLLDQDPSGTTALKVWLSANGSVDAPDVVFLALDNGYAVWTGRGTRLHTLVLDRSRVRRAISELLRAAADPDQPVAKIREEGRFIYDQLLSPLSDIPTRGVLTILPDEEIAAVPFSMLTDAGGKWLDESYATVLTAGSGRRVTVPSLLSRALVVGAPATKEPLPPLPDSKREAEAVAERFLGSTMLTGPDATLGAVTAGLEAAGLFHFSGHGYAGSTVGGLYLADRLLTSVSLQGLRLGSCRLAVLSACLTAKGQTDGLTNPDSLVHALLDAGVETVIASRWNVDSAATAEWMEQFYSDLTASRDPAQALQRASRLLRARSRYQQPYYWAAFQAYQ